MGPEGPPPWHLYFISVCVTQGALYLYVRTSRHNPRVLRIMSVQVPAWVLLTSAGLAYATFLAEGLAGFGRELPMSTAAWMSFTEFTLYRPYLAAPIVSALLAAPLLLIRDDRWARRAFWLLVALVLGYIPVSLYSWVAPMFACTGMVE